MGRSIRNRYILFSHEEHEAVQTDFTHEQIKKSIGMWEADFSINLMYRKLNIHKVSVGLIAIDLEMRGLIKPRKNGLFGTMPDSEYDVWLADFNHEKQWIS